MEDPVARDVPAAVQLLEPLGERSEVIELAEIDLDVGQRAQERFEDTGEGRWTVEAAIEESVPTPVIAESLFARFRSRMENTFGDRMLAMMRAQFGGHAVVKDASSEK